MRLEEPERSKLLTENSNFRYSVLTPGNSELHRAIYQAFLHNEDLKSSKGYQRCFAYSLQRFHSARLGLLRLPSTVDPRG
jgi:hypothetical protein